MMISDFAHARCSATLAAVLATTSLLGCDPDDGDANADTDAGTDAGTDAQDADEGSSTGGDDQDASGPGGSADASSGGSDTSGGIDDPDGGSPFEDDPEAALGALSGMAFRCYDDDDIRYTLLFWDDGVTVGFDDDTTSEGSYDATTASLSLSFPELGFAEDAIDAAFALDALAYFETPSLRCGAIAFDHTEEGGTDVVSCPTIKYIPETSWETNEFQFGPGGYVLRRTWTELPAVPDTIYSARAGLYLRIGDHVYMVIPFEDEGERWLTGTVTEEGLFVDQLEPESGACE